MIARRMTELEIAARVVPTMLRWPSQNPQRALWDQLREAVEGLRDLVRTIETDCRHLESDPHLNPEAVRRRRVELGERMTGRLLSLRPVEDCERAIEENTQNVDPKTRASFAKAIDELREGVASTRRAIRERCQMRGSQLI